MTGGLKELGLFSLGKGSLLGWDGGTSSSPHYKEGGCQKDGTQPFTVMCETQG